uniref:Tudor domain containing 15 n=1 Tax=Paramormyrops kingsleyae TaxID=1676925 RepID=A0A3B3SYH5_9TELE
MDLFRLNLGRHVDVETFFFLIGILTEVPVRQRCGCAEILLTEKPNSHKFLRMPSSIQEIENLMLFFGPQLTVGKKEKIRVTAAINTNTFYCQLESMVTDLKEMSEKLSTFCESKSKGLCDNAVGNLGLLCAVNGKDDKWYRGVVQLLPVNSQVRVLFVDYGFCESVGVERICQLPPSFLSIPIMAFHCTLSCLSQTDENVLKEQLEHIKRGLLGAVLDIQVDSFDTDENLYSVTLDSVKADAENGELQKNDSCLSRLVRNSDFCKMGKTYSVVKHTNENKGMEYSEDVDSLKDIKDNSIFRGFVEYVLNPSDFWLRTEERNCRFEDMLQNMAKYFSDLKLHEGILENPVPGTLCCAMYEKDMQYYRAVVREIIENGAEVFFIDFGNTERVPYMFIKKLPPEFAGEPKFAINCSLAYVVSVEDVWTTQAASYFRQAVLFWKSKAKKLGLLQSGKFAKYQGPNKTTEGSVGTELSVRCCHFNSSSDFWCQPQSKLKNLDKLMAKIQSYYQENADAFQLHEACCVAQHQEDGKWYRGHILRTQYNEFDVLLVDFGLTIRQKAHNLRAIKPEFLELEMQAFRCSVYPLLEPAGEHDVWSTDADKELKTFVQSGSLNLKCTVHSMMVVNGLLFSVVDIHTSLQSATKLLVEKGLAKPVHYPKLFPSVDLSSYVFSMFDIKIGGSETVYVTHVCSPWQLFFQLDRNGNMLEDLMEEVTKQSNEIPSETSGSDPVKLCLAKYIMDDKWYRGLAFPVQSNQHLNVLFVDYGNIEVGYISHVSTTTFYIQMENEEKTILRLAEDLNSSLFREQTELITGNVNIGDLIAIPTVTCDNVIRKNLTRTESKKNTLVNCAVVRSKRRQLIMSSKHRALMHLCKIKRSVKCISQGVSDTSDNKNATIPPDPKIIPGQIEEGTLLSVLENGDFYIRLHQNSRDFTSLCHLLQKEAFRCSLAPVIGAREGLECLAKSTKTNQWYRAVVQKTYQGNCSVFLLDHGISEVVSVQEIRELSEELRQIPVQAILCRWNVPVKATEGSNLNILEYEHLLLRIRDQI